MARQERGSFWVSRHTEIGEHMKIKMKSHRGAAKRFRAKKGGKVKFKKQGLRHILVNKSSNVKRQKTQLAHLGAKDTKVALRLLAC